MNRTEAYSFLKLYLKFMHQSSDYVKIVDCDPANEEVEIKVYNTKGENVQKWVDLWTAAKIIEANSASKWPF